jgi:multidrug resistance efflux pump
MVNPCRLVFTPFFAWFSVAVLLLAGTILIANWHEIHASLAHLYRPETVLLAWLMLLVIVMGHELSHGLTCKRFGGEVHEIGLLLIYLQPAMYCNVSDAWLFPEKRKRLLVTLAGAWFEVLCWGLATLFWRVTEQGSLPNYLAMVMAATLGIKILFNFNPLIKLDGYYLLSDYLEIPNLRRRAYQHIGNTLGCLARLGKSPVLPAPPLRERRIYWLYGLLAATYSTWLIGFILLSLGAFLTTRYQGWGAVAFGGLVVVIFRNPLRKTSGWLASLFIGKKAIMVRMKRLARLIILIVIAAAALYFIKTDFKVSGEFRILPVHNAEVRAEVGGIIEEIVHDEGDVLKAGDIIARLSDRDYRTELEKVVAEIAEKEAKLKMLKTGARAEEIELARTTVTKGEERLKHARSLLDMERSLYEEKLSSKKDFETAAEIATLRASELAESKGTLKLLLAGTRPEEIEATEAELRRLGAQRAYLQSQMERLRITTPIAGVVTTHRLKDRLGNNLQKGELLAIVHLLQTVNAEIAVPEKEISEVQIGQPVVLKARAYLNQSFNGKVMSIAPVGIVPTNGLPQRTFLVVTELDNSRLSLRPEMTGNAKISCGTRRLYEIVFRRLIRFVRVEFWSWW